MRQQLQPNGQRGWLRLLTLVALVGVCGIATIAATARESLMHWPVLDTYTVAGQFSSRDRTGGNRDWSDEGAGRRGFLYRDVHGDRVLAEVMGPGELNRLWFTGLDQAGNIRIYLDDEATPTHDMPIRQLFAGMTPPFVAPHVYDDELSSGGFVSYVQLPFEQYLKVTTTGEPSYYHVGYHRHTIGRIPNVDLVSDAHEGWTLAGHRRLHSGQFELLEEIDGPTLLTRITFRLPHTLAKPASSRTVLTDHGRAFTGYSEFTVRIDPNNTGVRLVRRLDYSVGDQVANVVVDGIRLGQWSTPGSAQAFNWRDATFDIPAELTKGKESLRIRVEFVSSQIDWNEFYYWVYTRAGSDTVPVTLPDHPHGGGLVLTDTLDIGDVRSEGAHGYRIEGEKWSGQRDWVYPPPLDPDDEQLAMTLSLLRNLWLSISWDGQLEPAVLAPLSLFYATSLGPHPIDTRPIRVQQGADGVELTALFPMPFAINSQIGLHYIGPDDVAIDYEIEGMELPDLPRLLAQGEVGYFHATYRREHPTLTGRDYTILSTDGVGKVVGVSMRLGGPASRGYLEGDERIRVDGRRTPDIYGTGTEDHFGGGWYFSRGPFALPFYGAPGHAMEDGRDQTSLYRFFVTDPIPFRSGIQYTMEHGGENELVTDYESVVYWYGLPRAGLVLTDRLDLPEDLQSAEPRAQIEGEARRIRIVSSFEGPLEGERLPQSVVYHHGKLEFSAALDPANQGVILRRTLDQRVSPQQATVWVDGVEAGIWYHPETNTRHRFADADFYVAPELTQGKERVWVKIEPRGEWNAVAYEVLSQVTPYEIPMRPVHLTEVQAVVDGEVTSLTWELRGAEDRGHDASDRGNMRFRVYRAPSPDFDPHPWHLVGESTVPTWQEPLRLHSGSHYYRVSAVDGLGRTLSVSDPIQVDVAEIIRVEGEHLVQLVAKGGSFQRQSMDWVGPEWSGGQHLFFQAVDVGATVSGEFTMEEGGVYQVTLYYTLAPDYGQVEILIDGRPLGGMIDGYGVSVNRSGPLALGVIELEAGKHTLEVRVLGRHPSAHGYFAGIDAVEFIRVDAE